MTHLLDTNICSAYLRGRSGLSHRFIQYGGGLAISAISLGELYAWAFRRSRPDPVLAALSSDLLPNVTTLDFDAICARQFGETRAAMLAIGAVVNPVDLMIGSTALVHDLTLVTHNVKDFESIPGLRVADWLAP
jgi:tRNA(fMet)-specific endonuclease VapC